MPKVYIYVIARDYGFAPNPYHGYCSLATCKPDIRSTAKVDDWIFGVGGLKLKATGKCILAMKVCEKITYNEYWNNPRFIDKRPVRNGSKKMMVGDNIYHHNTETNNWIQAHSHHSNPNGSTNMDNVETDTRIPNVLLSNHFYYFGSAAPVVPSEIFLTLNYKNKHGHCVFDYNRAKCLVDWIENNYTQSLNLVLADPFNFDKSEAHYSVKTNRISFV